LFFCGVFLSSADLALTWIGADILHPVFISETISASEKRITGFVSLVGGLILWYLPKQPEE
jgi:hypothetical protein